MYVCMYVYARPPLALVGPPVGPEEDAVAVLLVGLPKQRYVSFIISYVIVTIMIITYINHIT